MKSNKMNSIAFWPLIFDFESVNSLRECPRRVFAKEMPRRTLRKRSRAYVDPECKLASDVAPAAQRPRKGDERAPLRGLGINPADQARVAEFNRSRFGLPTLN